MFERNGNDGVFGFAIYRPYVDTSHFHDSGALYQSQNLQKGMSYIPLAHYWLIYQ